ncbi:LysR family transcriptional regulator [Wenyingzhuangia sp. IMCC45574]
MINLEWLRTFRAVYTTKSLSKASELLNVSQPTVSQHIRSLEMHVNQKLFIRKSKGVLETDDGRILNTLVASVVESLEDVENKISHRYLKEHEIITVGISHHLYKMMFSDAILDLGESVHVKFASKDQLITEVEQGKLTYAIIPDEIERLDLITYPLKKQQLILVATPDIDVAIYENEYKKDPARLSLCLSNQTWYTHDISSGYVKVYWMHVFDKTRPSIVPNYVIPDEYELLVQLSKRSGLTVALDSNARQFIEKGLLKEIQLKEILFRPLSLITNKKKAKEAVALEIVKMITKEN